MKKAKDLGKEKDDISAQKEVFFSQHQKVSWTSSIVQVAKNHFAFRNTDMMGRCTSSKKGVNDTPPKKTSLAGYMYFYSDYMVLWYTILKLPLIILIEISN